MAAKAHSRSREPSEAKPENEDPSACQEESEEEEVSEHERSDSVSSEHDADNSGETGEDEDEDEDEDLRVVQPKIDTKFVNHEFGSDSDSDLGSPSNYKLQPISKPSKSSSKRTHQDVNEENQSHVGSSKKSKTEDGKSLASSPGGCITRLWSDDDEVTVLKGMFDFRNAKGKDPSADIASFHNFIEGKLEVDFSKDQLKTKIRRMKKRFTNALKKSENGEDPVFSKPHEIMLFDLSKKIWGVSVGNDSVKRDVVKAENVDFDEIIEEYVDEEEEEVDFASKYPFLMASFSNLKSSIPSLDMSEYGMEFVMKKLSSVGHDKAKDLNKKWKQLITEEIELSYKKMNLMKEQMKFAMDK